MPSVRHQIEHRQNRFAKLVKAGEFAHPLLLGRRKFAVPEGDGKLGYASPDAMVKEVNEKQASASFVISTAASDRDGDIVEPAGCEYDNFAKNPVVFFDHQATPYPVGMAESAQGTLSLQIVGPSILSTCFFHQKTRESQEVCELTMAGILRGASIGFRPIEAEKIVVGGKHVGFRFKRWELTEWSITPLGANQEALRLHLSRGNVKSARLRRQLEPWAELSKAWSNGTEIKAMSKQAATLAKGKKDDEEDIDKDALTEDDDTPAPKDDEKPDEAKDETAETEKPADDEAEKPDDEDPKEEETKDETPAQPPPGARDMANYALHTQGALKFSEATRGNHEPEMQPFFDAMTEHENAGLEKIKEAFATRYPDHDLDKMIEEMGAAMDEAKPKEDEEEQDSVIAKGKSAKKVIVKRMSKSQCATVKDASEFLADVAGDQGVPKRLQAGCKHHAKGLDDLTKAADVPVDDPDEDDDDEEKMLKALLGTKKKMQLVG